MIRPHDAWTLLTREIRPLASQALPLEQALGALLAVPLRADRDIPPADRAAMDGYAVRAAEAGAPGARLKVIDEVAAGAATSVPMPPGHCLRIFTGANLPPEADTVVAVEKTSTRSFRERLDDGWITITEAPRAGANVFRQGENARAGALLLEAGTRLGPRQIALAAATGHATVQVHRRPRVHILNTGAELIAPAAPAAAHQTRNANGPMLAAALAESDMSGDVFCRTTPDDPEAIRQGLQDALAEADAVIVTGGISAGRYDYGPQAMESIGARLLYRAIAMKPGKPQIFAISLDGKPIFGLPGNPLSSIVGFYELVGPALRLLAGAAPERCRPLLHVPLAETIVYRGDRQWICPARLVHSDSATQALPCPPVGSADGVTAARVHGAIHIAPEAGGLAPGHIVPFRPWGEMAP